jgi:hypothetical protein
MYIMTFSPIHVDGRFVGIAGADIALHRSNESCFQA